MKSILTLNAHTLFTILISPILLIIILVILIIFKFEIPAYQTIISSLGFWVIIVEIWFLLLNYKLFMVNLKRHRIFFSVSSLLCIYALFVNLIIHIHNLNLSIFMDLYFFIKYAESSSLFSFIGTYLIIISISKNLKSIELGKDVKFKEYSEEFMMLWFFPIGIWFLQKRIIAIINNNDTKRFLKG